MLCVLFPGFMAFPEDYNYPILHLFNKYHLNLKIVDYEEYFKDPKGYLSHLLHGAHHHDFFWFIGHSMGGSLALKEISHVNHHRTRLMLIDPVVEPIKNLFSATLKRMYEGFVPKPPIKNNFGSFSSFLWRKHSQMQNLLPQIKYIRSFTLPKKPIHHKARVLWAQDDLTSPQKNFKLIQPLLKDNHFTSIPNANHTWTNNEDLVKQHVINVLV